MTRYSPLSTEGDADAPHSPTSSSPSAAASDPPLSQKLVKVIGNVCFSFFVLAVLVVTVVAVTYQPPDPWLTSSAALTNSLSATLLNSTFRLDDSILPTGEDLVPLNTSLIPVNSSDSPSSTTIPDLVDSPSTTSEEAGESCNPDKPVNCSDPRVLNAVKAFNLKAFTRRSIIFLTYDKPVQGSKTGECDVAWRFRNRKDKSWRRYAFAFAFVNREANFKFKIHLDLVAAVIV